MLLRAEARGEDQLVESFTEYVSLRVRLRCRRLSSSTYSHLEFEKVCSRNSEQFDRGSGNTIVTATKFSLSFGKFDPMLNHQLKTICRRVKRDRFKLDEASKQAKVYS